MLSFSRARSSVSGAAGFGIEFYCSSLARVLGVLLAQQD